MSPRPRVNSDTEILMAAFRAIARLGPAKLTLGDVAKEANVSAASLVQRFGSKRALLLAAAADAAGGHVYIFGGLRARHRSVKAALFGLADCMSVMGTTPEEIANNLAFLQIDLADAEFLAHARRSSTGFRQGIRALIAEGTAAGEMRRCDAGRLAQAVQATLNGSMLDWAIHRQGSMAAWIRRDLKMVLDPYFAK
jgi:AcrR family transcriptional regulator